MSVTQPFTYLIASADRTPEAVAVSTPDVDVTYSELLDTSRRFARLMREAGVSRGDVVGVIAPALIQFMFVFAIFHEGGVGSIPPAGYRVDPDGVHDWLVVETVIPDFPSNRQIVLDTQAMELIAGYTGVPDLVGYERNLDFCRVAFSSGTTGRPKAIPFSVKGFIEKCTTGRDRWMIDRPFMSSLGLGSIMSVLALVAAIISGDTFVYPGDRGEGLLGQMRRHGVTCLATSPHQVSSFLTAIERDGGGLPDLRVILVTGSPLPDFLFRRVQSALGVRLVVLYASTEAGSMARRDAPATEPGYAGEIEPDVDVRIVDASGRSLPDGAEGEVAVRRSDHPQQYLDGDDASSRFFVDGYFRTGDTGYRVGHSLFLNGRVSEIINASGVKVDPSRIDEVALEYPGVIDAGAFGFVDARGLDSIGLLFCSDPTFARENFLNFLRSRLGESAPTHIARVSSIPRSETGKVLRDEAARVFQQNPLV